MLTEEGQGGGSCGQQCAPDQHVCPPPPRLSLSSPSHTPPSPESPSLRPTGAVEAAHRAAHRPSNLHSASQESF